MNAEQNQRTAADWFARRIGGNWTEQDEAEFDQWIEAAPAHRVQYIRIEAAWKHAARLKALGAGIPPGTIPPPHSWGHERFPRGNVDLSDESETTGSLQLEAEDRETSLSPPIEHAAPALARRARTAPRLALAVGLLLAVTLGVTGYVTLMDRASRYSTAIGATDTVPLKDGSHITLNTDTSIHVDLGDRERLIALDRGEAFFEVANDPRRPFVVQAGHKRVIAVGTKFSVRRDGEEGVEVIVTEGKVRLEEGNGAHSTSDGDLSERSQALSRQPEQLFTAGTIVRTSHARVIVRENATSDAAKRLSWRSGYVTFDNTALADAVAELNRYNTRKILIEDTTIAGVRIGGNFRIRNTEAFLDLLQSGHAIAIERTDDQIILKAR